MAAVAREGEGALAALRGCALGALDEDQDTAMGSNNARKCKWSAAPPLRVQDHLPLIESPVGQHIAVVITTAAAAAAKERLRAQNDGSKIRKQRSDGTDPANKAVNWDRPPREGGTKAPSSSDIGNDRRHCDGKWHVRMCSASFKKSEVELRERLDCEVWGGGWV